MQILQKIKNNKTRFNLITRLFVFSFAFPLLSGCQTATPIIVDDKHATLPSLRVDIDLGNEIQPPAYPHTGNAVEFAVLKARGGSKQTLAYNPPVFLNNTMFHAPQLLRNDIDFNFAELSYRRREFFRERNLGLEYSGGLGYSSMNIAVTSATQQATGHFGNYGLKVSGGMIWRMRRSTSLNMRLSGFFSTASTGVGNFGRCEFFLAQSIGENLVMRAGYAHWKVNGYGAPDLDITLSGPTIELGLAF